mmetsp:Transcript_10960/g.19352  ORF Transcript_10960/g.19352 Transcript_10960/m.19352 type:complete len:519 (+) Transcript_10960:248-1804(+)
MAQSQGQDAPLGMARLSRVLFFLGGAIVFFMFVGGNSSGNMETRYLPGTLFHDNGNGNGNGNDQSSNTLAQPETNPDTNSNAFAHDNEAETEHGDENNNGDESYIDLFKGTFKLNIDSSSRPYPEAAPNGVFFYTPSGGFNNQLICLLNSILFAKRWGRDVMVPPAARHHNYYFNYLKLSDDDIVPMDKVLDLDHMSRIVGVRLIPMQGRLQDYFDEHFGPEFDKDPELYRIALLTSKQGFIRNSRATNERVLAKIGASKKRKVMIYGRYYKAAWGISDLYNAVRYNEFLHRVAISFETNVMGGGAFNAIHMRLGDKFRAFQKKVGAAKALQNRGFNRGAKAAKFGDQEPIYLATDADANHPLVLALQEQFPTIVINWWEQTENPEFRQVLSEFETFLTSQGMRIDMYGFIEQLICIRARHFVGSSFSTFSKTIYLGRIALESSAPDIALRIVTGPVPPVEERSAKLISYGGNERASHKNEIVLQFGEGMEYVRKHDEENFLASKNEDAQAGDETPTP